MLLDSVGAAANGLPRLWGVYTLHDNGAFAPVASGVVANHVIPADFQGGKNGRYLLIASNGTAVQWWSTAKIAISSGNNLDRGGLVITSSEGASAAGVGDNSTSSRSTAGVAQAGGRRSA